MTAAAAAAALCVAQEAAARARVEASVVCQELRRLDCEREELGPWLMGGAPEPRGGPPSPCPSGGGLASINSEQGAGEGEPSRE